MVSDYFLEQDSKFHVHEDFFVTSGVDRNQIRARISESVHGKISGWRAIPKRHGKRKVYFIELKSIPKKTLTKYKIPDEQTIKQKLADQQFVDTGLSESKKKAQYKLFLDQAIQHAHRYAPYYYEKGLPTEEIIMYGRRCSVLLETISIKKNDYGSVQLLWDLLQGPEFKKLHLPIKNIKYFYGYIKEAERSKDIRAFVINGLRFKPSNHTKANKLVTDLIIYFKGHGNNISNRFVKKLVNALSIAFPSINRKKQISESTVSAIVRLKKTEINIRRKGAKFLDEFILPFMHLLKAENPLDIVYIDGYFIQVACKDDMNNIVKYVMVAIQDGHSGRILGYAIGETENSTLVLEAFRMMLLTTGFRLPAEIITDGHSSYKSEAFKRIKEFAKGKLMVKWVTSGNPQRKAILERWFGSVQTIHLSPHFGYIGEGIMSTNEDGRPKKEVLILLRDPTNLRNLSQMRLMMDEIIASANKTPFREEDPAPNDKYRARHPINAKQIGAPIFHYLMGQKFTRQMRNMEVQLTYKQGTAFYAGKTVDEAMHNLEEVDCYMDYPYVTKSIYVFKKDTDKFIGEFKQIKFLPTAYINQTEEQRKEMLANYKSREKLKQELIQRTKDLENRVTDFFGKPPEELLTHILDTKASLESMDIRTILNIGKPGLEKDPVSMFQNTKLKPHKKSKGPSKKQTSIIKANTDYSAVADLRQL